MKIKPTMFLLLLAASPALAGEKLNFNPDWRFIKENPAGAEAPDFNDSAWVRVSAPHTYNDIDTFDDWSPQGHKGEMNQWGGKTWYRKHFDVPAAWKDKSVILEFEAVRQVADVYCNGVKVGRCENGFVPFGADLTKHLKFGQTNVIAVACDNTFLKDGTGKKGVHIKKGYAGEAKFPWNNPHWHPAHGGLYRNVYLHVSDKLHLTRPLFNNLETVGTYVYAVNPSRTATGVGIEAEVENATGSAQTFTVRSRLLDREGNAVMTAEAAGSLAAGKRGIVKLTGKLSAPRLWEPKHPHLYRLVTEIVRDGAVVDADEIPFGVRWIKLSMKTGFHINDRHVKLQGWGIKSVDGWPGLGAANPDWMHHYTLRLITDAGGNFVRWGHTCGGPIQIRAADELGIVTLQPGVDGEGDTSGHAWDVRLAAFRDVVIYFRNSASILFWEGGNQSVSKEHLEELKEVVKRYDPHGNRPYGHRRANKTVAALSDFSVSTEGSGYIKSLPTLEGEYNREESPRRVWDRSTPPYEKWHANGSYDLTAEEYAINQLAQYRKIAPRSHSGGANWIFVDSTSGGRVDTEVTRTSGELDAMRLPKEAYHVCRVIFTDEPDLHLIGHWNYPKGTFKDIYVACDGDAVSLLLNGKKLKPGKGKKDPPMLFTFPKVAWQPGTLTAVGYKNGKEIGRHELKTTGPATALRLTPMTGPAGWIADGSDAVVFDVEAIDKDGLRVPTFIGRCNFKTSGPCIWRGGYNSGKIKSTNNTHLDLEAGINRVILRSTLKAGTITLTATSQGLEPATVTVTSKPIDLKGGVATELPAIPAQGALTKLPPPEDEGPADAEDAHQVFSDLLEDVAYTGPSGGARIETLREGAPLFTDNSTELANLPEFLRTGEFIQLPNADWNYSAVDLLQFGVRKDATVYVAHDHRLKPKMAWLTDTFSDTGKQLKIGKHAWQLFEKKVKAGDSVLLGSNTENKGEKRWMMIVFVVPSP